jgi:hypothetical protein
MADEWALHSIEGMPRQANVLGGGKDEILAIFIVRSADPFV